MPTNIREYTSINPKTVVSNIETVLRTKDIWKLNKQAYELLHVHMGFIAHGSHNGFCATYEKDLVPFVNTILRQSWNIYIDNPKTYLFDTKYRGVFLNEIVKAVVKLTREYERDIKIWQNDRDQVADIAKANELAQKHGYRLVRA